MEKTIWLTYDLGVGGDYPGLYKWLDNHHALECGTNVACFKYHIDDKKNTDDMILSQLEKELETLVDIKNNNRIYVIRSDSNNKGDKIIKGKFLFGNRKSSPWVGYGNSSGAKDDE
ncbi:MAG: hypothetical protein LKM33_03525 [Bacteroidales bacterium]|jgi:hypothetical protein|nr:hypothetical protein [Bacteroidales bacterium]